MKRYEVYTKRFSEPILMYGKTPETAAKWFEKDGVIDVKLWDDMSYLDSIQVIKSNSKLLASQPMKNNEVREWYKAETADGIVRIRLAKDLTDDLYFDIAEYQFTSRNSLVYPMSFVYSNPKDVEDLFFSLPLSCEIYSYRFYGQARLEKPKELKGMRPLFIVYWAGDKGACQCFIKDGDLWIRHRDFFSEAHIPKDEDIGTPLSYRLNKYFEANRKEHFIYADSWGEIILRNEAWLVFKNFENCFKRDEMPPVRSMIKVFLNTDLLRKSHIHSLSNDWESFFENICNNYLKATKIRQ